MIHTSLTTARGIMADCTHYTARQIHVAARVVTALTEDASERAATRCGLPDTAFNASAAAHYLRDCCGIESRRQLNDSCAARNRLDQLRTEFDAWTGRIARQHPMHDRSQNA